MSNRRLLVIDDEPDIGAVISEAARRFGFEVIATENSKEFWSRYEVFKPTVIFLDLKMPQVDGVQLLRELAARHCRARIVLVSGVDQRVLQTAMRLGRDQGLDMLGTLLKPFKLDDARRLLENIPEAEVPLGEAELHQAIRSNQIVAFYQPKVELSGGEGYRITACEALARWQHPQRGLLGPEAFIPLAEESELIEPLSDLILKCTVEQLAAWQAEGLCLHASLNLSPRLLGRVELPDLYDAFCRSHDVDPGRITLEMTESAAMRDVALIMDILTRFRLKGFGLSLDDFGTGYSSLVQLHRLPFNEMKIDKSFVIESDTNEEAVQIIRSIAGLADNLRLRLCAEGVETETALALVREVGCHTAQGYLIGRPMPAEDIAALVRSGSGSNS